MASRLPIPGSDDNQWGDILNDFLNQAHNPDGSLKALTESQITNLTTDLAAKYVKPNTGIAGTDLSAAVQASLTKADVALPAATAVSTYATVINVSGFGAKGDGATDDAPAIQAALNSVASTGGTVWFPPGVFVIGSTLIIGSGVTLKGSGAGADLYTVGAAARPSGTVLQLKSGANCDLIQTQYFAPLDSGTTMTGAQATNSTLTVASTAGFPSSGQFDVNLTPATSTFAVRYTGKTATSFTGLAGGGGNGTIQPDGTVITLTGSNYDATNPKNYQQPTRLAVLDMTLEGNKANNVSGRGLAFFANAYQVKNVIIQNFAGDGAYSNSDHNNGYEASPIWDSFHITDCNGNGLNYQGRHDGLITNGSVARCGSSGVVEGAYCGTLMVSNVHVWGCAQYNWDLGSGYAGHTNCISDGSGVNTSTGIRVTADGISWLGGSIYGQGRVGEVLVQVGAGGVVSHVRGCKFDCPAFGVGYGGTFVRYMSDGNLTVRHNEFRMKIASYDITYGPNPFHYGKTTTTGSQLGNTATLTVASTTGFPTAGQVVVGTATGSTVVTYTGTTGTSFTGCTGGSGALTLAAGSSVLARSPNDSGVQYGYENFSLDPLDDTAGGYTNIARVGAGGSVTDARSVTYSGSAIYSNTVRYNLASKTSSYTIAATDMFVVMNAAVATTATLPNAATAGAGHPIMLRNAGSATVTVGSVSGTIDGAANQTLTAGNATRYVSDGTNWWSW